MPPTAILVVDDHALFRSGLRLVLEADFPEAQVFEANSIHDAIHMTSIFPSIVLLDILMDGLNGLDGMALLKRKWPEVEIIMLSSDTALTTSRLALERGASAFVSKAETAKKIITIIAGILDAKGTMSALSLVEELNEITLRLTTRQYEVLDLLAKGLSNKVIARELGCAENTVRGHVQAILAFFNVTSRSEATYAAKIMGIIQ